MRQVLMAFLAVANLLTGFSQKVQLVDSADLTGDMLRERNGKIIVEMVAGIVENEHGDGTALNPEDCDYAYISYSEVSCNPGDLILTFLVYDPATNGEDDVIERIDMNMGSACYAHP